MAYYRTAKVFISKGSDGGARPCQPCAVEGLRPSLHRPKPWDHIGFRPPKLRRVSAIAGDRVNLTKLNDRRSHRNRRGCPRNRVERQHQITCSGRIKALIYIRVVGSSHRNTRVSNVCVTVARNQRQNRPYDAASSLFRRLTDRARLLLLDRARGDRNQRRCP